MMADHVHMMIAIPPKYAVSQVIGFIKGRRPILNDRKRVAKQTYVVGNYVGCQPLPIMRDMPDKQTFCALRLTGPLMTGTLRPAMAPTQFSSSVPAGTSDPLINVNAHQRK
jgi:hypothetical protein